MPSNILLFSLQFSLSFRNSFLVFSTIFLSLLMHSLIRVSRRDEKGWDFLHKRDSLDMVVLFFLSLLSSTNTINWTNLFIQFITSKQKYSELLSPLHPTFLRKMRIDSKDKYFRKDYFSSTFTSHLLSYHSLPSPSPKDSQNFISCHLFSSPSPPFCSLFTISSSFHFDFSILFNFPSQYFSSIGLHILFRLRWNLPPLLWRIPNLHDSPMNDYSNETHKKSYMSLTFSRHDFHHASLSHHFHHQFIHLTRTSERKLLFNSLPFYLLPLLSWIFIRHY